MKAIIDFIRNLSIFRIPREIEELKRIMKLHQEAEDLLNESSRKLLLSEDKSLSIKEQWANLNWVKEHIPIIAEKQEEVGESLDKL